MSKYFTVKEVISGLPEEKVPHRLLIDAVNEKLIYDLDEDTRIDLSNASELLKKQDKFAEITTDVDNGAIETIFLGKTDLIDSNFDFSINIISKSHSFDSGIAYIVAEEDSNYGDNVYTLNLYNDSGEFAGGCVFRCDNPELLNLISNDVEFELTDSTLTIIVKAQNCVQVENVADPIKDNDAANKGYVDNKIPSGLSLIDIHGYYPDGVEEPVRVDVNFTKPAKINIPTLDVNIENQIIVTAPNGVRIKSDINSDPELILNKSASGLFVNSSRVAVIGYAAGINVEGNSTSPTGHAIAIAPYVTDDIINDNDVPLFDSKADGSSAVLVGSNESRIRLYADYIDLGKSYPEIDLKSGIVNNVNTILGIEDIGLSINYLNEPELSHQAATKNYVDKSLPIISADEPLPEEGRIWLQPANVSTGAVDYIVERGIIDNWHYTKWASGECELYGTVTVTPTTSTAYGSTYYSEVLAVSMPFSVTSSAISGVFGGSYWMTNAYTDSTGVHFRLNRGLALSINNNIDGQITIKGLWK